MKKLLFVTHEQFWPLSGGCTAGNFHILKYLASHGFEVTISTPLYTDVSSLEKEHGFKFKPFSPYYMHRGIKFRIIKYLGYGILSLFHLIKIFLNNKYDVVYVNNAVLSFPFLFLRPFLKSLLVIRYTDFLSGFLHEDKRCSYWLIKVLMYYEYRIAALFDKVFVITPAMKRSLCGKGNLPESKVIVTFDGVDADVFNVNSFADAFRQVIRMDLNIPLDVRVVMFHGTVEPHHGEDILAGIILELLRRDLSVHILLIGVGFSHLSIRDALKAEARVCILDFVPYERIPSYINASDAGIIPYPKNESMDMVLTLKLLEYLSLGVRCITFDLDSIEEIFGQYDFVKISHSRGAFVDNIAFVLMEGKSKVSPGIIRQDFTWDKVAEKMRRVLSSYSK